MGAAMTHRYAAGMPPWLAARVEPSVAALRVALADGSVRRLIAAWFAANAGSYALLVITLVIAYEAGGPVAVGFFGLARYLTATVVAPFVGLPAARWPAEAVLRAADTVRIIAVVAMIGIVALDGPLAVLAIAVAVEAGAGVFSRPLHMGILPAVAQTPQELIAANVTSGAAEGLGTFAGPALASILLVSTGPVGALVAVVVIYVLGLASIARLHVPSVGRRVRSDSALADLSAGVRAAIDLSGPRIIIAMLGLQTFVRGLLTVLIVVAAIELLGMGEPGVGTLNAVIGLGGLLGAVAAITLAGRERLGPPFTFALAGWGAPIIVMGLILHPAVAIVAMTAVGISNAVLDVAGFTLIQRLTPNAARVGVLGLLDSVANAGPALGGLVAPWLISAFGAQSALVVTGAILPLAALATWPMLRHVDEGRPTTARLDALLRHQPLFAPLSLATIEYLGTSLKPVHADEGTWLMREGEAGDRYLLVDVGEAEVLQDGRHIGTVGPGGGVGEIALLRDVPRTASVKARTPIEAFSLDRESFLEAVTGSKASATAASTVVDERLAADRERVG
jgi:hypothetical protein